MNSLLLSILAVLSADFLLQSKKNTDAEASLKLTAIFGHGIILFGAILFFLHGYQWLTLIRYAVLVAGIHLLIDLLTALLSRIPNRGLNLSVFIMKQVLHLLAVFIIWSRIDLPTNQAVLSFYESLVAIKALPSFAGIYEGTIKLAPEKLLMGAIVYIYICCGGSVLIDKFLAWIRKKEAIFGENTDRAGKWIGILERLIVLSLILNDALGSVAFILTAKSIARFNELSNRDFAEYYLVGTLASTMLAIGGGFILNYLLALV